MKPANKILMFSLCRFYKGEVINPFMEFSDNRKIFWDYEKSFFSNPNVFQSKNLEEDFKAHILNVLDGPIAENYQSLDKAVRSYFGKL